MPDSLRMPTEWMHKQPVQDVGRWSWALRRMRYAGLRFPGDYGVLQ